MATEISIPTSTWSTNYELWKLETQAWTVVTELSNEKQTLVVVLKVRKVAKIRNRYNKKTYHTCPRIQHGKVTKTQF